jgi:hypothetical protein
MLAVAAIYAVLVAQTSAEQAMRETQRLHIEANVPAPADFNQLLRRDLVGYFEQARSKKGVAVQFELLRDGPTQSGVAYPKFYAWVTVDGGESAEDRGAVRVAAIEKKRFEVTDFVSELQIQNDLTSIEAVFPAQVCERIRDKVKREHRPRASTMR